MARIQELLAEWPRHPTLLQVTYLIHSLITDSVILAKGQTRIRIEKGLQRSHCCALSFALYFGAHEFLQKLYFFDV